MKKLIACLILLIQFSLLSANSPVIIAKQFEWDTTATLLKIEGNMQETWTFEGATHPAEYPTLPFFTQQFPLAGSGKLQVEILEQQTEAFEADFAGNDAYLKEQLSFETDVHSNRNQYYGNLSFCPILKKGNRYERLVAIKLRVTLQASPVVNFRGPNNETSKLADGAIYKIAISETGMHKLSYDFLKTDLGMDLDNIDPRKIQVLGNGGGILPEFVQTERIDDLLENRIQIVGEEDGSFDANDYLLFYAEGPNSWAFNEEAQVFEMTKNIYDLNSYYFIKVGVEDGLRLNDQASLDINTTDFTVSTSQNYIRLEEDKVNVLHAWPKAQGSGKVWYGDHFKVVRSYTYDNNFPLPDVLSSAPVKVKARMILRATQSSRFTMDIAGQSLQSSAASRVTTLSGDGDNEINYANQALINDSLFLTNANPSISVDYPFPSNSGDGSEGWLDYIQLNYTRNLQMTGQQVDFRNLESTNYSSATFQLANASSAVEVWDITNSLQPSLQATSLSGSLLSFGVTTDQLREFVAFDKNQTLLQATAIGPIENQNLHGITDADLVVLYPSDFEASAERLVNHRKDFSGYTVAFVNINQVFNEFSSGSLDPTAIRDFAKMLYDRSPNFQYLLLFGDGSFDPRGIYELGNNFIPVYEAESLNPIFSFPTDDYYGLLSGTNPNSSLSGMLNITIGRLPVKTVEEAEQAVDKIIHYETHPETFRDWRNRLVFVGDDEDNNIHLRQANNIATLVDTTYKAFNLDKVFLDAFPQVSTPGGQRFPTATEAINNSIFKGTLVITYLGHGGSKGWAQERVLNISDILNWDNFNQQPLFLTATCSFTGYDDAGFTTAGEEVFLNAKGGAIALMTTVRAVYSNQNAELTEETLVKLFARKADGTYRTLGEVITDAKNAFASTSIITNSRKFALIGDPSMKLAIPRFEVATTAINDRDINTLTDTLGALQKVTIEGIIKNPDGSINTNFNGLLYPTIFDKKVNFSTLGQDAGSYVTDFALQKNIIFKGRASVTAGKFRFTFVIPKDINYQFGPGKISYYAADETNMTDASGNFEEIIIGGTDANALLDDQGPEVEVFMNTEDFVFGGITDPNPTLLVKLQDDNGINVVGNSIGHDLEGVLDDNTQNTYLLNEFYESELDDYTKGTVRFPLADLEEGRHQIRVKAWDVANNSAEGYTEFLVTSDAKLALQHVLNYPNPFTDYTCFQFDHNLANQELDIMIHIYTVSGRLVKTLEQTLFSDGAIRLDDCISWDGRDDYGDPLARGIYLYKVKVRTANTGNTILSGESEFEKLVILK